MRVNKKILSKIMPLKRRKPLKLKIPAKKMTRILLKTS